MMPPELREAEPIPLTATISETYRMVAVSLQAALGQDETDLRRWVWFWAKTLEEVAQHFDNATHADS